MSRDEGFEAEALPQSRALYGTACRLTRNPHDAEDLVQETLSPRLPRLRRYTPGTNIRAWLYTILHRVRADVLRRRAAARPRPSSCRRTGPAVRRRQEALATGGETSPAPLEALPEPFRTAVVLRDVEELSYEEIAKHRGRADRDRDVAHPPRPRAAPGALLRERQP